MGMVIVTQGNNIFNVNALECTRMVTVYGFFTFLKRNRKP